MRQKRNSCLPVMVKWIRKRKRGGSLGVAVGTVLHMMVLAV